MLNQAHKRNYFIRDLTIGGCSGAVIKTIPAPLERVKLLLQTQSVNLQLKEKKYKGIGDCFKRIYTEEGVRAYWRGNLANVIRYIPTAAFSFAFRDYYASLINAKTIFGNMIAGGLAGVTCTFIVYPLDLARTRLGVDVGSTNKRMFNSISHCLSSIYKVNGVRGLYEGLFLSALFGFAYRAMYFGFYHSGKSFLTEKGKESFLMKYLLAQSVTIIASSVLYPTDTLRRMMTLNSGRKVRIHNTTLDCLKNIYKRDGIKGFFRGNLSNMMRTISSSFILVFYDEAKQFVEPRK